MKLPSPGWWLGAASLGIVLLLVFKDLENTTPGPLSAAHAQDPALADTAGCILCHGSERGALTLACNECHAAIREQLASGSGFHGRLANASDCGRCHLEHEGPEFELAGAHAFALAGVPERDAYAHAGLDLGLSGVHAQLTCERCHPNAEARVLAAGTTRFLGLTSECAECHADPHEGEMSRDCESCHGQERPFVEVAEFEHVADFPLTGAHAGIACAACHAPHTPHSIANVLKLDPNAVRKGARGQAQAIAPSAARRRACEDCHDSPHTPTFLDELTAEDRACTTCHSVAHTGFDEGASMDPALHAASGFPLAEPHAALACAACHAPSPGSSFAARHPGRRADDCAACHADPHDGQFADQGCVECHTTQFQPHGFDRERHAGTAFPLTGKHAPVDCHACHVEDLGAAGVRSFRGTPSACEVCHTDAHDGAFDELGPPSNPAASGCARCHTSAGFDQGARERFDHDAWTRFPLVGAHAAARCEACHTPSAARDALGRLFGRAHEVFPGRPRRPTGEPRWVARCDTCHLDAHAGAFQGTGEAGCESCHDQSSFAAVDPAAFDHGARTGFVLDGAHALAACSTCHARAPVADAFGRRFGRAPKVAVEQCAACHADPHGGAFGPGGPGGPGDADGAATDCAACHSTAAFTGVPREAFDHGERTGFPLLGAHGRASCTGCHTNTAPRHAQSAPDPQGRTFGRASGTSCADCHSDPHAAQFARGADGATDCARCHTSVTDVRGFHALTFDHSIDARFALDRVHAKLACSACHTPWRAADGSRAVRYRPLGTACIDCHKPGDGH